MESVLATAIFEMGRKSRGKSFGPEEVVKWIFPVDWRHFLVDVKEVMMQLYREGRISVTREGLEVDKEQIPSGEVRITVLRQTKNF